MTSRHGGLSLALRKMVLFMKFDESPFRRDAETNTRDACATLENPRDRGGK